jgi:AcrR family transcriptional regulator
MEAALALFAEHGVSGTSLQMIADALGVTKAAVYHQFPTKDEIVLAVIRPALDQLGALVGEADTAPTRAAGREIVLAGMIDLVIEHRRLAAILLVDPTVARLLKEKVRPAVVDGIDHHLGGPDPSPETRVAVAMVVASVMNLGVDPHLQDLDDETLRENLLICARRLLGLRAPRGLPTRRGGAGPVTPAAGTAGR